MQNIGLNTEQPFKSGHSLWFQNSKPPLSWGFQDNLPKKAGCPLRKQPVNSPKFRLLTGPRTEKAAGLVHLDARWYNPQTTRFIQPDLWNFASTGLPSEVQHEVMQFAGLNSNQLLRDPGQQMRFGYTNNNPINKIDLTGFETTITIDRKNYGTETILGTIVVSSDIVDDSFSGYTLENATPTNSNLPVDQGSYSAFQRTDRNPNRVQLNSVPNASAVQLHVGNFQNDFDGCFGVGTGQANNSISGSRNAMNSINNIIDADGSGNITVNVNDKEMPRNYIQ